MPYSTNSLPSASHTRAPRPRTSTGAIPSGYWSEPFANVCAPPGTISCRRACNAVDRSKLMLNVVSLSVRATAVQDRAEGLPEDVGVEGEVPVLDVAQVEPDGLLP